ncbi:Protein cornichon 1 [Sparganum proliferum]
MGFGIVAVAYIFALLLTVALIFLVIYHIIAFDELKTDYKNPIDQCRSLNPYGIHAFITLFFLLTWQVVALFINIPLLIYNIQRYANRPVMSGFGLYHPTTVLTSGELNRAMKEGWVKLAFYILTFFYYLYGMIATLVSA